MAEALTSGGDIQLQAYYDRVNRRQANQAEYRNTFDVDFVHHFNLTHGHSFIWGLGVRLSPASLPQIIPTYQFDPAQRTDHVYTAYAQDEISFSSSVKFTAGAKLLHSSFRDRL